MQPLVLQLQAECLDSSVPVSDVLRKALVVARKLSLKDAQTWIEKELNGYKNGDEPPPYRIVSGQIRAWNPYRGWIPVFFQDPEYARRLAECFVGQPVGELEDLVRNSSGFLEFPFDPTTEATLAHNGRVRMRSTRHFGSTSVVGVLDAVRNLTLNWSMDLERDGILGENLVFSEKEKQAASHANYTVNYNAPVTNSQVQQSTVGSSQSISVTTSETKAIEEFLAKLTEQLPNLGLQSTETAQIKADVETVQSQLKSPKPSRVVIGECLRSVRSVLEGIIGNIIAAGLLHHFPNLTF